MTHRLSVAALAILAFLPACGVASVLSRGHSDSGSTPKYSAVEDETSKYQANPSFATWIVAMRGHLNETRSISERLDRHQCKADCDEQAARLEQLRARFKGLVGFGFDHASSVAEHEQLATLLAQYQASKGAGDLLDVDARFPKVLEGWQAAAAAQLAARSPEQTAQDTGKGTCAVGELREEPAVKGKKRVGPTLVARVAFDMGATAHVHCAFPNPLTSYSRSKPDTFDVEAQVGDRVVKVTELAANGTGDFELPMSRVLSSEAVRGMGWIAVHVRYRTHVKSGTRAIRDAYGNVRYEDEWSDQSIASGELLVKVR